MGVTLGKTAGRRFQSCLDVQDVLPATAVGGAADNTADVLLPEPPPPPEEKVALIISPPSSAAHVVGCHQCRMELHQGSLMSLVSSTSTAIDGDEIDEAIGQSLRSLEHTHTMHGSWRDMAEVEEECAACSALSGAVAAFYADGDSDEEEDSLVIEIHHVGEDEELSNVVCHSSSVSDIPVKEAEAVYFRRISPYDGDAFEKQRKSRREAEEQVALASTTSRRHGLVRNHRHHEALTMVDVDLPVSLLNCCQEKELPDNESDVAVQQKRERSPTPPGLGSNDSIQLTVRHTTSGIRRASTDGGGAGTVLRTGTEGSRRRPHIRLTSVDGLELSITSPRQDSEQTADNTSSSPRTIIRCGAKRPPIPVIKAVASGPKGSSKDDSNLDYSPTANGDYNGPETLTIMRRSSSKKRSERAATAANTITELDDSVLESQVMAADLDDVDSQLGSDEDGALAQSTSKICETASFRLKCLMRLLEKGDVRTDVMQKNLKLAIRVLDTVYLDEAGSADDEEPSEELPQEPQCPSSKFPPVPVAASIPAQPATRPPPPLPPPRRTTVVKKRRTPDEEDDLSEVRADAVPPEVRAWLASTFTRQHSTGSRKPGESDKPKFRSVAQAIRAGILVERIYRRMSSSSFLQFPAEVARNLKLMDEWTFDVFALSDASAGSPLRYLGIDLLNRYGVIHKFKIPTNTLEAFLNQTEAGYCKHRNLYHNNTHAADVSQTLHYMLYQTGLMNWLTDLEIFAAIIAAIIHDFEHTGTTNSFHVMSGSETALLYNDRAVQENHHISAAFRLMKEEECNILVNLTREEYREFRSLVIDMVLSTDMSCHFQQIKAARNLLSAPELIVDKSRVLSLVLHCCDVSHPSKPWAMHRHWTDLLLEEFFRQGDNEKELGLPYSPLCDRNTTLVAESQIGFIEFIVEPSMTVLGDLLERILLPNTRASSASGSRQDRDSISEEKTTDAGDVDVSLPAAITGGAKVEEDLTKAVVKINRPWDTYLEENKAIWKELSVKDQQRRLAEQASREEKKNED